MSGITGESLLVDQIRVPVHLASRDHAELLELTKNRAPDASIFEQHPPVFFDALVSQKIIDAYSTMMMRSTLKNYAADAGAEPSGVTFQDSHKYDGMQRTLGRSIEGRFIQARGDTVDRTVVTFFTQPTLTPLMQEFTDRMRSGLAADVSVGFTGGRTICSICGGEMFGWWYGRDSDNICWHYPGMEYAVKDEDGKKTKERVVAIGQIEDAHLSEVSTVFDGATPGAGIIGMKARAAAERGLLPDEMRRALESRWQIDIKDGRALFLPGAAAQARADAIAVVTQANIVPDEAGPHHEEERTMTTYTQEELDKALEQARTQERALALAPVLASLRATGIEIKDETDLTVPVRALQAKIDELTPRAKDGDAYRDDLVEKVVTEGVRVWGNKYDKDAERAELRGISLDGVKRRLANYEPLADDIFKEGRSTEDGDGPILNTNTNVSAGDSPTRIEGRRRRHSRAYGA